MNNVLIITVHPDNESPGCGGTLLKHKESGDFIHWLIGTNIKEEGSFNKEKLEERGVRNKNS